jgi:phage terminase large subunit-like protein
MSGYAASAKQYAQRVVSGEILTCEWVQKACKRQLDDLIRFKRKSSIYQFNPELLDRYGRPYRPADNLVRFHRAPASRQRPTGQQMIVLEPWQVFILSTVFGWVKSDGKRRFRRSYIEVPRGNAKSTLSSAVGLYMLAADREGGAEVYSLATTRDQARIVFGDAQTMARLSPGFQEPVCGERRGAQHACLANRLQVRSALG